MGFWLWLDTPLHKASFWIMSPVLLEFQLSPAYLFCASFSLIDTSFPTLPSWTGDVAQAIEVCFASVKPYLSSNPSLTTKKKKKENPTLSLELNMEICVCMRVWVYYLKKFLQLNPNHSIFMLSPSLQWPPYQCLSFLTLLLSTYNLS
jgi:hypothetical protein